jgi:ribosomal protein L11 methylase PrmA
LPEDILKYKWFSPRGLCDEKEKEDMDANHEPAIKKLEEMWDLLNEDDEECGTDRVIDVACGTGRVTKSFLLSRFKAVDMFDTDEDAIDAAKELRRLNDKIDRVDDATM